jgi:two-component sensor histidine kinase
MTLIYPHAVALEFFAGGGEMGALMRAYEWDSSVLGPPAGWPQSLRVTIRLILNTRHPMFIWWGPELVQFYNDAYRGTMGTERHPSALGDFGGDCWAEIWDTIGPQIDHVMGGKGSSWDEDRLIPVTRNGKREDVWWTYSYAPIDLDGGVGGVLVVCNDVTAAHLSRDALKDQAQRLQQLFEQAPGFMAVLRGPDHVFELTNSAYKRLFGDRDFIGKSVRDALPEVAGQGFFELLDTVFQSGEAHVGARTPITFHSGLAGTIKKIYVDFVYQPIVEADGTVSGIFVEGFDVSDHFRAEDHLQLLNSELHHRVKNMLGIVSSIATQTLDGKATETALPIFQERLTAFAKAHDILTSGDGQAAMISDVINGALIPYRNGDGRVTVAGPALTISPKQALALALAIHELATNATKYGALSDDWGRIEISWTADRDVEPPTFHFRWTEADGPEVKSPTRKGFGSVLIERGLKADFGGIVATRYDPKGLTCTLAAPLRNLPQN